MFESKPEITRELIHRYISDEQIFEKYLGFPVSYGEYFCNPLREDNLPTCSFAVYKEKLRFRDWTETRSKDSIDVVIEYNKVFSKPINYQQALEQIAVAFNLIEGETPPIDYSKIERKEKTPVNLQIKRQNFTSHCIKYWESQGISVETLRKFNVVSLRAIWIRGRKIYDWSSRDLAFGYVFSDDIIKVYFPLRNKTGSYRFLNSNESVLEGYGNLPETGDYCLITKSYKDVMCCSEFDIPAVATSSEVVIVPPLAITVLRDRFPLLLSLMDNDRTGKRMAWRLRKEYGVPPLLFEKGEPKDFTDNRKTYGYQYMIDLIEHVKNSYAINTQDNNSRNTA